MSAEGERAATAPDARYGLRACLEDLRDDLRFYGGRGRGVAWTVLFRLGFQLTCSYRLGRYLEGVRALRWLGRVVTYWQQTVASSQISPRARVGRRIDFPHPIGIVIGAGAVIGDDVRIFQHVTLGSHGDPARDAAYPHVERGVTVYTGATLLGGVRIGHGATIGAGAVVTRDVPARTVAIGVPAKIVDGR